MRCAKCGAPESHHFEDGDRADSLGRCDGYVPVTAITRDMLLSEVRRSLMATHPDRAEALCAALEAWLLPVAQACESCGGTRNVTYDPNPFAAEIHNDQAPCWMCDSCRAESAADI